MSIKGIKVKYAKFITSLSIFKGTINTEFTMNLTFKELRVRYAELMALLSIFKDTVDMN